VDEVSTFRRVLGSHITAAKEAKEKIKWTKKDLTTAEGEARVVTSALSILQDVAHAVQQKVHGRVAGVVSHCLAAVFGENSYKFDILFLKKRGKTEAKPVFVRNGNELDPADAVGGGVLDVAAFALRVVCLVLKRPAPRKLLVLDEPFKNVSERYQEAVKDMLLELSGRFDLQILMVTHQRGITCGKVIDLS